MSDPKPDLWGREPCALRVRREYTGEGALVLDAMDGVPKSLQAKTPCCISLVSLDATVAMMLADGTASTWDGAHATCVPGTGQKGELSYSVHCRQSMGAFNSKPVCLSQTIIWRGRNGAERAIRYDCVTGAFRVECPDADAE